LNVSVSSMLKVDLTSRVKISVRVTDFKKGG
jgi:hypothetical protein